MRAIGPASGLAIAAHWGHVPVFVIVAVLTGLGAVTTLGVTGSASAEESDRPRLARGIHRFIDVRVVPLGAAMSLFGLVYAGMFSFVGAHAQDRGLTNAGSVFFLLYSAHMLAVRPVVGRLVDRRGTRLLLYGGLALLAVGMVLMGRATDTMDFALAGALCGAASGTVLCVGPVMALRGVPPSGAAAVATYFIFLELAAGLGPWILGGVIPLVGYGRLFDLLSLVSLATVAAFWLLKPLLWK